MGWDSAPPTQAELQSLAQPGVNWDSAPPTQDELKSIGPTESQAQAEGPDIYDRAAQVENGLKSFFQRGRGPIGAPMAFIANPAVREAAGKIVDYPLGYLRTGVAEVAGALKPGANPVTQDDWVNTLEGNAPGAGDYAVRFGMPNPAAKVPFSNGKTVSAQDAVNIAGNVVPLVAGEAALRTGPGAAALESVNDAAGKSAEFVAKKTGKVLFNLPEDTTGRYLADQKAIDQAPSRSDIADRIMSLKDQSDAQVTKAHSDLQDAKSALTENKGDVRAGQQDEKFDAQQNLHEATQNFNEKKQAFREALKTNNLTNMSSQATQAVADLKAKVIQGSKDAYSILDNEKGSVDINPIANGMNKWSNELTVNGVPTSNADAQALNSVTQWQSRLRNMTQNNGGKLSLPQAKQVIQGLDREIQVGQAAGDFSPKASQALTELRGQVDDAVKDQSDAYKQKMLQVSGDARLLNKTNDLYGTPEDAIGNLNGVTSQKGQAIHLPLLKQLGDATGRDLAGPANDYIYNHKVLSTPSLFEQIVSATPEAKELVRAQARIHDLANPASARETVARSSVPLATKVDTAQSVLDAARNDNQLFSGISRDSVTGKTRQLGGANDYAAQNRFGPIDEKYGTNFQKEIQARNDSDAFASDATRGSRLTVAGGALGGGLGFLAGGGEGAAVGATLGAEGGAIADRYGGQLFKGALKKGIQGAKLAKTVAADTRASLAPAAVGSSIGQVVSIGQKALPAAAEAPTQGPAKWANDGAQNLIAHGADKALIAKAQSDPKMQTLLIKASDLKPGTKAMDNLLAQVKSAQGGG